jgi:hypothetical protein
MKDFLGGTIMVDHTIELVESLDEVRDYLPKIIRASDSTSELFYEPLTEDSLRVIQQVIEGFNNLNQMLSFVKTYAVASPRYSIESKAIEKAEAALLAAIQDMNVYLRLKDYVAAGDTIKYSMIPLFEQLQLELGEGDNVQEQRFQDNLVFLKDHHPIVYNQVKLLTWDRARYKIAYSKDFSPNLIVPVNEQEKDLYYLYSKYNPQYEAQRWIEYTAPVIQAGKAIFVYGLGLGYHLFELLREFPDASIYVYEPDEQVLLSAMRVMDFSEFLSKDKIKCFIVGENKKAFKLLANYIYYSKEEILTVDLPVYTRLFCEKKNDILELVNEALQDVVITDNTMVRASRSWTRNSFYNLSMHLSTPSLVGMKGALERYSVVILGAGPSLETDIEYIRELKNHAVIIAAGTTVQALQLHGIKPHLIISMDGYEVNYLAFKDIDTDSIPFLYFPQIEHRILENRSAEFMHAFFEFDALTQYIMGLTSEDPVFVPNHSVTGSAIQASIYMGCKEIIFAGQDLSFPGDKYYSDGAKHVEKGDLTHQVDEALELIENVQGTMNRTNTKMKVVIKDLEDLIIKYPDVRFINTTRHGAKIEHTQFEPIENTIERLASSRISSHLVNDLMHKRHLKYDKTRVGDVISRLHALPVQLNSIQEHLITIQSHLNLLGKYKHNSQKCLKEMGKIEDLWGEVVHTKAFTSVYARGMSKELIEFDHTRPQLEIEQNLSRKADLFVSILGKLVSGMLEKTPAYQSQLGEAISRVNALDLG